MENPFVSRGFTVKKRLKQALHERIPPGQHLVDDSPVLAAGPNPKISSASCQFTIEGLVKKPANWNGQRFELLKMSLSKQLFSV